MFGNVFLNLIALTMTTPSMVTLLQPTQPVFASILASCLGHESMTIQKAAGVILSVSGSVYIALTQDGLHSGANFGVLIVLAQCASGANYVVQQRPLVHVGYSPLIVSSCSYIAASAITVVVGVVYFSTMSNNERSHVKWWDDSYLFIGVLLYVVFLTTVYNYVAMAWATGKLGATVVTLFGLLQGVFASFVQWKCFGLPVSLHEVVGAAAIFTGLITVVTAPTGRGGPGVSYVDTREVWANALTELPAQRSNDNLLHGPGARSESLCTKPASENA